MYRSIVCAFFAFAPFILTLALADNSGNWECRDGSYITMDARCDGVFDCKDHSDESHALCWELYCPPSRFRCAYGACVDMTAPCNGVEECADGSDEVMPKCRNNTRPIHNGQFTCYTGEMTIQASGLCDGKKDCLDGSDESLAYCAGRRCTRNQFQCAYGACVDPGSNCDSNQNHDCADGSDESDELCNRNTTTPSIDTGAKVIRPCDGFRCNDGTCLLKEHRCDGIQECSLGEDEHGCEIGNINTSKELSKCVLPPYPELGSYAVAGRDARPGQTFESIALTVVCPAPYRLDGPADVRCDRGVWSGPLPQCKAAAATEFCELPRHHSVTYFCGDKECNELEPSGTEVFPKCKDMYTLYGQEPLKMTCLNNRWNYIATCLLDYKVTSNLKEVVINIGQNIVVRIKGSKYSVALEYEGETLEVIETRSSNGAKNTVVDAAGNKESYYNGVMESWLNGSGKKGKTPVLA